MTIKFAVNLTLGLLLAVILFHLLIITKIIPYENTWGRATSKWFRNVPLWDHFHCHQPDFWICFTYERRACQTLLKSKADQYYTLDISDTLCIKYHREHTCKDKFWKIIRCFNSRFFNSYLDDSKEQRSQTVTFKQYVLKAGSVCYQSLNYVKNIQ